MKHEKGLLIRGEKVVLVPYRPLHVHKYHEWMGDPEILRLTGSERLSLEEEYEMQQTWERDTDKCTFIILDREKYEGSSSPSRDEAASMVGDTNLFLNVGDDYDEDNENSSPSSSAEIEIMIAEKEGRRKGFATEALKLMMDYGKEKLGTQKFIAKIKADNESSIKLFERLGYRFHSKSDVFEEITMVFHANK